MFAPKPEKPALAQKPVVPTAQSEPASSHTDAVADAVVKTAPESSPPTVPASPKPDDVTKMPPPELRAAYESTKKRMVELEGKMADYTEVSSKYKQLSEQHDKASKRLSELEDTLRYVDYTKSPDYLEKYVAPIKKASQDFADEFLGFEKDGKSATEDDLGALLDLPNSAALARAHELFGDLAGEAMAHRRKIRELGRSQRDAIENFKKMGAEREQQQRIQQETFSAGLQKAYKEQLESLKKAEPTFYGEIDGDNEGNEALESGYAFVDVSFDPKSDLSPEQRAKNLATVRSKAGAFDRVTRLLNAERQKTAELTKQLEEYQKSDPGSTFTTGEKAAQKTDRTWRDELRDQFAGRHK